jgi:hypothetical protein
MIVLIREGNTNSAACRIVGINYVTWRFHIEQNPDWRAELAETEKIRDEVWRDHAVIMVKARCRRTGLRGPLLRALGSVRIN